jgi:hypothetical protein
LLLIPRKPDFLRLVLGRCCIFPRIFTIFPPQIRFKTLIRDTFSEEPRKSILKREAHSFEDYRQGGLLSVQRGILNRKAKSFEERDEEYDKVRRRIFRNREMFGGYESVDEQEWQWMQQERNDNGGEFSNKLKVPNRMMKVHVRYFFEFSSSICFSMEVFFLFSVYRRSLW